ncbi:Conserved_hypothetical protein [Hexamita inflata]|uniref:Uncharacterized protein n=1 Tax=Hexamita inflata TaxID=28002 RepID=A0AA86Q7H1_9EUKA|nr:Conserved hypothetical protein [Hexamita inflata]
MLSHSLDQLKQILQQKNISQNIIEQIVNDAKHGIERLPNSKKFKLVKNELTSHNKINPDDYSILMPILTTYTSDLSKQSMKTYFQQNPDQLISMGMSTNVFTLPEQINTLDINQLNNLIKYIPDEDAELHSLFLDDITVCGTFMSLLSSNLNSLDTDLDVSIYEDIEKIDFSNNCITYKMILKFLENFPKVHTIKTAGIPFDLEIMKQLQKTIKIEYADSEQVDELEIIPIHYLQIQNSKICKVVYQLTELTTEMYMIYKPLLDELKVEHLIAKFDADFDFSMISQPFVNFNPCMNPVTVKYAQTGAIQLTEEVLNQMAESLQNHIYECASIFKSRDVSEKYAEDGRLLLNEENNFALALYPSVIPLAQKSFSQSNPEFSVNCLQINQLLPNGEMALIFVPLRTIEQNKCIYVNTRENAFDVNVQKFWSGRNLEVMRFSDKFKDQNFFNVQRKVLAQDIQNKTNPKFVFEATEFGIYQFMKHSNVKKDQLFTPSLRKIEYREALFLLVSRSVNFIIALNSNENVVYQAIIEKGKPTVQAYNVSEQYPAKIDSAIDTIDLKITINTDGVFIVGGDSIVMIE